MASFVQAMRNRSDRADWARVSKQRGDEVRQWLADFRQKQGWQPGMVWDLILAKRSTSERRSDVR